MCICVTVLVPDKKIYIKLVTVAFYGKAVSSYAYFTLCAPKVFWYFCNENILHIMCETKKMIKIGFKNILGLFGAMHLRS